MLFSFIFVKKNIITIYSYNVQVTPAALYRSLLNTKLLQKNHLKHNRYKYTYR